MEGQTRLHLGDQLLVEQTPSLLVKRAVDSDNITLCQHLLQIRNPATSNLLLDLGLQRLVIEVQQLLTIERLETAEHTLSDTANGDGTDDLALEIELVLGCGCDVPLAGLDLLVCGNEVADENEDGHDDMFGDGDDVGASHFGDGDSAVGLVGCVQVDVIRSNTSGDRDLELLRLGQTLCGEISGVETGLSARYRDRGSGRTV